MTAAVYAMLQSLTANRTQQPAAKTAVQCH